MHITGSMPLVAVRPGANKKTVVAMNTKKMLISAENTKKSEVKINKQKEIDELVGFALSEMAEAHAHLGLWDKAFQMWSDALQLQIEKYGKQSQLVAQTLRRRGNAYAKIGEYFLAVTDLEHAVHLMKEIAKNGLTDKWAINGLANTLVELGNAQQNRLFYIEAMRNYQSALALKEEVLGAEHVDVGDIHLAIGRAFHQRRRYRESKRAHQKALAVYKAALPPNHPYIVRVERSKRDRNMIAQQFFDLTVRLDEFGSI